MTNRERIDQWIEFRKGDHAEAAALGKHLLRIERYALLGKLDIPRLLDTLKYTVELLDETMRDPCCESDDIEAEVEEAMRLVLGVLEDKTKCQ